MKKYCLIGKSLPYSLSAEIHGLFGLDYSLKELSDSDALDAFARSSEYDGFNVTIPYKQEIVKYLNVIGEEAKRIGAVNTVVRTKRGLEGYNTDIYGVGYGLYACGIDVRGKAVAVLGSGGTSKTVCEYLRVAGTREIIVVSRRGEVNYDNIHERKDIDVIINTTPVGTFPENNKTPIDISAFPNLSGVFDVVYNPLTTRLIQDARKRGIPSDNGLSMLVEQARCARDIFTSEKSDISLTENVIAKLRKTNSNVVLIGMPGSGKSTVGQKVATLMGKDFVDIDSEIEKAVRRKISDIIASEGESAFRAIEKSIVQENSKRLGTVIATGGGVVLDEGNIDALKRNGVIIYLTRDIDKLPTANRPLSQRKGVKELFLKRKHLYEKAADIIVLDSTSVDSAAKETVRKYEEYFGN